MCNVVCWLVVSCTKCTYVCILYMHETFTSLINNFRYVQSIMLSFYSHIKKDMFFFSLFQTLVVHTTVLFPIKYGLQQLSPSTTYDHAINQERNICLFLQFIQDTCLCNKLKGSGFSPFPYSILCLFWDLPRYIHYIFSQNIKP